MLHLYARMPDGTEHDFGPEKAALVASMPESERNRSVNSFVVTELIARVGAGNVGEFPLHYQLRED